MITIARRSALWDGSLADIPRAGLDFESDRCTEERLAAAVPRVGFRHFHGRAHRVEAGAEGRFGTFGYVRDTNFGAHFDVRSVPDANDLAYTSLFLDPHTDNPYRSPVPGVQLLHCLANETSGGLSTLVDGFAAAETLRSSGSGGLPAVVADARSVPIPRRRYRVGRAARR